MIHDLELIEYDLEHKGYWVIGLDADMDIAIVPSPIKTLAKAEEIMMDMDALTYPYGTSVSYTHLTLPTTPYV